MVLRGNIFYRQFLELQLISGKDIAVVCGPFIAILVKNCQLQHALYKTLVQLGLNDFSHLNYLFLTFLISLFSPTIYYRQCLRQN